MQIHASARSKISAFVISYNGETTIRACLRSLSFADEIILVDKSSADFTVSQATGFCDRVFIVPWTPTVEETRQQALELCQFDWVVFLDDDEILNLEAVNEIQSAVSRGEPTIYGLPRKEYILGSHSSNAYYWPNWQIRFFNRNLLRFSNTVHAGYVINGPVLNMPVETGAAIEHLSHPDVSTFIEKTNRYTSQASRTLFSNGTEGLADFAHAAIERWASKSKSANKRSYENAVALLMATYEIVDALKVWESQRGIDGKQEFRVLSAQLEELWPTLQRNTKVISSDPDKTCQEQVSSLKKLIRLLRMG